MDKYLNKNIKKENDRKKLIKDSEEYGYDFVPTLNNWLNIDEQRKKVKKLEDIE